MYVGFFTTSHLFFYFFLPPVFFLVWSVQTKSRQRWRIRLIKNNKWSITMVLNWRILMQDYQVDYACVSGVGLALNWRIKRIEDLICNWIEELQQIVQLASIVLQCSVSLIWLFSVACFVRASMFNLFETEWQV